MTRIVHKARLPASGLARGILGRAARGLDHGLEVLIMVACDRLPPPDAGCVACAARDQVIAELGQAVEELRA